MNKQTLLNKDDWAVFKKNLHKDQALEPTEYPCVVAFDTIAVYYLYKHMEIRYNFIYLTDFGTLCNGRRIVDQNKHKKKKQ